MSEPLKGSEVRCPHCGTPFPIVKTPAWMLVAIFCAPLLAGLLLVLVYVKSMKDPVFEMLEVSVRERRYEDSLTLLRYTGRDGAWTAEMEQSIRAKIRERDEKAEARLRAVIREQSEPPTGSAAPR